MNKKIPKKTPVKAFALLFSLILIISSVPFAARGAENVTYSKNGTEVSFNAETKVITVSGEGPCFEYYDAVGYVPWAGDFSEFVEVVIEEGITSVGEYYFYGGSSIKKITFPSTLKKIENGAFKECTSLSSVVMPDGIEYVGNEAFSECTGITSIKWSESLEYIGDYAFDGCSGVKETTLPESVKHIGERGVCFYPGGIVNLPETLDYIGYRAIANSKYYRSLPTGVISVYGGCTLTIIGTNTQDTITIPEGTKSLSQLTIKSDSVLNTVNLPSTLESIEKQALFGCKALFEITIPDSVTSIGEQALGYYQNSSGSVKRLAPFTIYGHSGCESERYALDNGFDFVCLHEVGSYSYYPNCEKGGFAVPICKWCNEEFGEIEEEPSYHVFGEEYKISPTCDGYGYTGKICTLCGYCEESDIVPATGHDFSDNLSLIKAPTCTESGTVGRLCSVCGAISDETEIVPTGHAESEEWTALLDSTCTESGLEALYCSVCNGIIKTREIPATGHSVSNSWSVFVKSDPLSGEKGFRGKLCDECGVICEYEYFLAGDLDSNGSIGIRDLKIMKKVLNGSENDEYVHSLCDLNCDGSITSRDLKVMKGVLSGK